MVIKTKYPCHFPMPAFQQPKVHKLCMASGPLNTVYDLVKLMVAV